jgi:uncharacterized repeat protein (TIGR03847 family)
VNGSFDLESPDHFTAGTLGPPGERIFYLQARQGPTLLTLRAEKEQVRGLGTYLERLLVKLPTPEGERPELELLEPIAAAWVVGTIGVGHDEAHDRIIVVATELVEEEGAEPATARVHITRMQAAAFVERAAALVSAGRPVCPMCGQPKDPGGHVCPRSNGHVVRA